MENRKLPRNDSRNNKPFVRVDSGPNAPNRGNAQSDEVAIRLGAVPLEVAVQAPLALGYGQGVVWQREMIHANVHVTRFAEHVQGNGQHGQFFGSAGQLRRQNAALRLEPGRQVSVGVQGNALGPQCLDLLQCVPEGFWRLQRQAVDQIHVDRLEPDFARGINQRKNLFCRLHAMHSLLHCGVKVLNPKTQAVEAELVQMF